MAGARIAGVVQLVVLGAGLLIRVRERPESAVAGGAYVPTVLGWMYAPRIGEAATRERAGERMSGTLLPRSNGPSLKNEFEKGCQ